MFWILFFDVDVVVGVEDSMGVFLYVRVDEVFVDVCVE